jgi:hypothetical protein
MAFDPCRGRPYHKALIQQHSISQEAWILRNKAWQLQISQKWLECLSFFPALPTVAICSKMQLNFKLHSWQENDCSWLTVNISVSSIFILIYRCSSVSAYIGGFWITCSRTAELLKILTFIFFILMYITIGGKHTFTLPCNQVNIVPWLTDLQFCMFPDTPSCHS